MNEKLKLSFSDCFVWIISRLGMMLVAYPVCMLLLFSWMELPYSGALAGAGLCIASAVFGCAVSFLLYLAKTPAKGVVPLRILACVIAAAGLVLISLGLTERVFVYVIFGVLGICFCLYGGSLFYRDVKNADFYIGTLIYLFVFAVLSFRKRDFSAEVFMWLFLAEAAIFAVMKNYEKINLLMRRRGHNRTKLPPKIRRFNLILLCVVIAVVLVLLIFRVFFGEVLGNILASIGIVLKLIFEVVFNRFLFPLTEKIFSANATIPPTDEKEKVSLDQLIGLEGEESFADSPLYDVSVYLAVTVTLVLAVIVFWRPIMNFFSGLFGRMAVWLRKKLYKIPGLFKNELDDANEFYTDEYQDLEAGKSFDEETSESAEMRRWKRSVREYRRMSPGRERFLYGYRAAVRGLSLKGVKVGPGDTALDLVPRSPETVRPDYTEAAGDANLLVFSGQPASPDYGALDRALDAIADYEYKPEITLKYSRKGGKRR